MLTPDLLIPPALWVTLGVAGICALGIYAWQRPSGIPRGRWAAIITFMALAFAVVMTILLNPRWVKPVPPPPGKPLLTILVDRSASMATPDGGPAGTTKTRYAAAIEAARAMQQDAGDAMEVHVRAFDEKIVPATLAELSSKEPTGEATDLAAAITAAVEPDRPQGQALVLLSDAIQTAGGADGPAALREAARFAKSADVPIYGENFGGRAGGIDLAIQSRSPRDLAFIGQKISLAAGVRARGYTGPAVVRLLFAGKEIDKKDVQLSPDAPAVARFQVMQEKAGLYPYEMKVDAAPGELTDANNSALCLLRVVDKPLHVMLVEGKPYWDSKFLMRQLAGDESVEMHSMVQLAPGRVIMRTVRRAEAPLPPYSGPAPQPAAPQTVQDTWQINKDPAAILADPATLSGCQVLILGRDIDEFLSDAAVANIQRWLSKEGGALVCYRGAPVMQMGQALSRLLPVKWQPAREMHFQIKLTDTGRDLNWFGTDSAGGLGSLPPLAAAELVQQTKPLATIVAQAQWHAGDDTPAVTYQPYGAGRVVVIEGAGMWRWAFPPPRPGQTETRTGEEVYGDVWHALFRWIISDAGLVPGESAAIRPDRNTFTAREPASATLLVRVETSATKPAAAPPPGPPTIDLKLLGATGSDPASVGRQIPCEPSGDDPGAFRANFGALAPGRYQATLSSDPAVTALFDVQRFGEEELNLAARPDVLERLAADSGGIVLTAADVHELVGKFKEHLARSRPTRVTYVTAWDRWWLFAGVLLLWCTAWALRRSSGLV